MTLIISELESRFRDLFIHYYTTVVEDDRGTIIVSIKSYEEPIQFTYQMIMQVAEIFGTTEFKIQNKFTEGEVYSEETKDSNDFELVFIKTI